MANAIATLEIPASPDQVWQLIGGFNNLPKWLPFIVKSEWEENGMVRNLTAADGANIIERLESFNYKERTYSYSILKGPAPVENYFATITVKETDKPNVSIVEWKGSFSPVNVTEAEVVALYTGIYTDGLNDLKNNF
ncbi:SRPBCC family protein [Acinetobacter pittii]|uniref:SRPBCC family protein n=1 Tax=Acinetobacter pittii TaxID=48296 RepID=UPI001EE50B80|nr:SRPBCC family protein [Acinetobacter pittii]MCG5225484.1 SRPBCC family protein [Acinetobacter pittii]